MIFATKIINWYKKNKRELPWREVVDPYSIWLSEVILQQTRVNQGLPYYLKFINNYPTVVHLANAAEDAVLKDWQGLGYYSRARNLHAAAKMVAEKYNGKFPATYQEIITLKGIGPYTAAAIASIAFNEPHPVIDGNVERVIARIFGVLEPVNSTKGRKQIAEVLNEVFDTRNPADFNQAIMEFGALQCKPQSPDCEKCPFMDTCYAYTHKKVNSLPLKEKKTKVKARYFLYIVPVSGGVEYIRKRTGDDIWKGLYEFPLIEMQEPVIFPDHEMIDQVLVNENWKKYKIRAVSKEYKHVLTHRIIYARFVELDMGKGFKPTGDWVAKPVDDDERYAFPVLIQNYINDRGRN